MDGYEEVFSQRGGRAYKRRVGGKRWHVCLTAQDFAAIEFVRFHNQLGTMTDAVRLALRGQLKRPRVKLSEALAGAYSRARVPTKKSPGFRFQGGKLKTWCCWMAEEEFEQLGRIRESFGIRHDSEAFRFALRVQAELDGFIPTGGKW